MMPCERLWPYLSRTLAANQQKFGPSNPNLYAFWITENSSDNRTIENHFNARASNGQVDLATATALYINSMTCERDFFLQGGGQPVPPFAGIAVKFGVDLGSERDINA
jgi:hypothetical protein